MKPFPIAALVLITVVCLHCGCAEGPLWQTGKFAPWVKKQWEQEAETASTLHARKQSIDQMLQAAATQEQRKKIAEHLGEMISRDPVLLMRLHAVTTLGKVNHPEATRFLKIATTDPDSKIRIAAIRTWQNMPAELAIPQLQDVVGSDTDVDVRLAATKALGQFTTPEASKALSFALTDNNPAIQYRAMESLENSTGQRLGNDVRAWQTYLDSTSSQNRLANRQSSDNQSGQTSRF